MIVGLNRDAAIIDGNGGEVFWPILGTAVKIAQSVSHLAFCTSVEWDELLM